MSVLKKRNIYGLKSKSLTLTDLVDDDQDNLESYTHTFDNMEPVPCLIDKSLTGELIVQNVNSRNIGCCRVQ